MMKNYDISWTLQDRKYRERLKHIQNFIRSLDAITVYNADIYERFQDKDTVSLFKFANI